MVRILTADDHPAMLLVVRLILEEEEGWEICGEATNGEEAVSKALELRPDIVILDFLMPRLNGLEAARRIAEKEPRARMILLTVHDVDKYLVDEARDAGIRAALNKSFANLLPCAVRVLLQGEVGTFFALDKNKTGQRTR